MSSDNNQIPFEAPPLDELQALFPTFSIDSFLAQGGMGAVYLATQTSLERQVAIKILPRELGTDETFRASFAQEAKAMARLNHPNLIGVYDFGEADGMPFIVMEYVHGKSLHDAAYGTLIDLNEAGDLIAKISRGLGHAHEKGILHRDVKPANILLDTTAEPKLGDFGLATRGGDSDGLIYGTPGFAAPEVYQGLGDARADLYAAAVSLYALITGEMPADPYLAPSQYCGDSRLDNFLIKALRADPNQRYQSASEFVTALEEALKKKASPLLRTAPAQTAYPAVTPLASGKKGNTPLLLGAGIGIAAVGLIAFLILGSSSSEKVTQTPSTPLPTETPEAATEPVEPPTTQDSDEHPPVELALKEEPAKSDLGEEPVAEPLPEPEPEKVATQTAETSAASTNNPPEPKPVVVQVSTFDHDSFLRRGRDFFRQRGEIPLAKHRESLLENIAQLESDSLAQLSKDSSKTRDQTTEQKRILKLAIKAYEDLGKLPADLATAVPNGIRDLSADPKEGQALAQAALDRQSKLRDELASSLASQAQSYAQGIQKQIAELQEKGNQADAQILESEARLALAEPLRFLSIVEGVDPPAGRAATAAETLIQERILGEWTCGITGTSYHFLEKGRVTGKGFDKEGHWQVRDQKITVRWDNGPIHVLAFSDFENNPDLCEGEILTKGKKIKAVRNLPFATQELAEIEPILGEWIHEAVDGPVTYTFRENKTANDGRWNSRGTYQKNFEGGYRVDWVGGKSFNLDFDGEDALVIRGLKFRMTRRK